jgi:polyisoprenoid-binding protein YceI
MIAFALALFTLNASAGTDFNVQPEKGKIEFHAIGKPAAIKIHGKGPGPQGTIHVADGKVTGELTVDLNQFETGIGLRDRHMKEKYLETAKHPQAKLKIESLSFAPSTGGAREGTFRGDLTLHDVTKPIEGKAKVETKGAVASVKSDFRIKISDYQIDVPTYMGITVANEVDVEVGFEASAETKK